MSKYNFSELEVGHEREYEGVRSKISACVSMYGKRTGKKFSTKVKEGKVLVTRVS